jgi:hypothetical protein
MSEEPMNKVGGDKATPASGIDPGSVQPGGEVPSSAKPNLQTEEARSFKTGKVDNTGAEDDRIDTDGDGRTRDPDDTRPTDKGGQGTPVRR